MRELFLLLLTGLHNFCTVNEAQMYKGGTFSSFEVVTEDGTYRVSISKEDGVKEDA